MTDPGTETAIVRRNRENARRSTGPRTGDGKARSAGNARTHGATARPDPRKVAHLLRIILDEPGLTIEALDCRNDHLRRAVVLAEAEVRLAHAEQVLDELLLRGLPDEPAIARGAGADANSRPMDQAPPAGRAGASGGVSAGGETGGDALADFVRPGVREERVRLARRYVSEARTSRNKAFAAWIETLKYAERRRPRRGRR